MSGSTVILLLVVISGAIAACPTIITKAQWGAREPKSAVTKLRQNPAPYVVIHHAASQPCTNQAICQARIRGFQEYHIDQKKWNDIGYNFLIGEDGNVYEGRGWGIMGAHAPGYNSKSIGICFIGNFTNREPSVAAVNAAKNLIQCAVTDGKLKSDYKLIGHRQASSTECPGNKLFDLIKTWQNWQLKP